MSKKTKKKRKTHHKKSKKAVDKPGINKKIIFTILLLIIGGIILYSLSTEDKETEYKNSSAKLYEPSFQKEGELVFRNSVNQEIIKKIDIEIADNYSKRMRGLMYRRSMQDNQGMLFIFEKAGPLYMWMKNTYISLDIIFINENYEIVSIQKYTKPLSTQALPSYKDAVYVVEVIAGFCEKYQVKEGDKISFKSI